VRPAPGPSIPAVFGRRRVFAGGLGAYPRSVKFQDYYATLGVARTASQDEIKRAYRKLAREFHPDVNKSAGADARFRQINEAYDVLGDPQKRERYDALGANWREGQDFDPTGFGSAWARHAAGGRGGSRGGAASGGQRGRAGSARARSSGPSGMSDFFEAVFGGASNPFSADPDAWAASMRSGGFNTQPEPPHTRADLTLSLADASLGCTKRVTLASHDGSQRTLEVRIPKGTTDGSTIRLGGQGAKGATGEAADVLLTIRVEPDPRFTVSGQDLTTIVLLTPWEAALGARVTVPTLDGEVTLTIPPGTTGNQRLRLKGKGIPSRGDSPAGDLYADLRIVLPKTIPPEQAALYTKLAEISNFSPRSP